MSVSYRSSIDRKSRDLSDRAERLVEQTLLTVQGVAAVRSRVATGRMRSGWTAEKSERHKGRVYNPVDHTIYNELGTRDMTAQPMLGPAVEAAKPGFEAGVRDLLA